MYACLLWLQIRRQNLVKNIVVIAGIFHLKPVIQNLVFISGCNTVVLPENASD